MPKISLNEAGIGENGESGKLRKLLINLKTEQLYFTCYQTENPCVGGSIPPLATKFNKGLAKLLALAHRALYTKT